MKRVTSLQIFTHTYYLISDICTCIYIAFFQIFTQVHSLDRAVEVCAVRRKQRKAQSVNVLMTYCLTKPTFNLSFDLSINVY